EAALPHLDRHGQARDGGGVQDVRGGAVESLPNRVRLCRLLLGSILLLSRGFARLWCLWIHRPLLNLPAVRHRPHALGSSTSDRKLLSPAWTATARPGTAAAFRMSGAARSRACRTVCACAASCSDRSSCSREASLACGVSGFIALS